MLLLVCTHYYNFFIARCELSVSFDFTLRGINFQNIKLDAIDSLPSTPIEGTDTGTRRSLSESLLESSFAPQNAEHISQLYSQVGSVLVECAGTAANIFHRSQMNKKN